MPYALLFKRALNVVRRDPALLVIGFIFVLLGGGSGGFGGSGINGSNGGAGGVGQPMPPNPDITVSPIEPILLIAIIVGVIVLAVLLALLVTYLQSVAQSGLIYGIDKVDESVDVSWRELWRVGFSDRGKRLFGLRLLLVLASLLLVVLIVVPIILVIMATGLLASTGSDASIFAGVSVVGLILFMVPAAMLVSSIAWVLGLVLNFAVREIVLNESGAVNALKAGWALFRDNVVPTVVTSFIIFVLTLMWTIPLIAVLFGIFISGGLLIFGFTAITGGFGPLFILIVVIGGILLWGGVSLLLTPLLTYTETVWTLLWRHLRGDRQIESEGIRIS